MFCLQLMKFKTFFIILLTVFITIILMQNTDEVNFKVLLWNLYLPKLVILTATLFLGILIGLILASRTSRAANHSPQNNYQKPYDTLSPEDRDYISD
ncbi:MAG: DUF1049 domain-containing protein [Sphingobacteriaceae bacterium]|nr:MAG: DUF1049 domain-containing protein [Sphingobacteriaceae bacterium]